MDYIGIDGHKKPSRNCILVREWEAGYHRSKSSFDSVVHLCQCIPYVERDLLRSIKGYMRPGLWKPEVTLPLPDDDAAWR